MSQIVSNESALHAEGAEDSAASIDYVELLLPLARHWRSLVCVFILSGVLGTWYAFTLTPRLQGTTTDRTRSGFTRQTLPAA